MFTSPCKSLPQQQARRSSSSGAGLPSQSLLRRVPHAAVSHTPSHDFPRGIPPRPCSVTNFDVLCLAEPPELTLSAPAHRSSLANRAYIIRSCKPSGQGKPLQAASLAAFSEREKRRSGIRPDRNDRWRACSRAFPRRAVARAPAGGLPERACLRPAPGERADVAATAAPASTSRRPDAFIPFTRREPSCRNSRARSPPSRSSSFR